MQPQQSSSSAYQIPSQKSSKAGILAVVFAMLFIAALVFGIWAYQGRQNYKNNSDQKAAAAAASARQAEDTKLAAQYATQAKQPYKTYAGSPTYGSISFNYPKTWSAYVDTTSSNEPINGYFYPDIVPATGANLPYALRVEVLSQDYASVASTFNAQISGGKVKAVAYVPPKLNGVANVQPGMLLTGAVSANASNGAMLLIKVRDKTLEIYTESSDYTADFNNIVLPSITFTP